MGVRDPLDLVAICRNVLFISNLSRLQVFDCVSPTIYIVPVLAKRGNVGAWKLWRYRFEKRKRPRRKIANEYSQKVFQISHCYTRRNSRIVGRVKCHTAPPLPTPTDRLHLLRAAVAQKQHEHFMQRNFLNLLP